MRLLVSVAARRDIAGALRYSERRWGSAQREKYRALIENALTDLIDNPHPPGSRARNEIRPGIRTLHIGRRGRSGRHFVVYRVTSDGDIQLVRVLHDAMELSCALFPPP